MISFSNAIENINERLFPKTNYVMLYDFGDECSDISGAWLSCHYYSNTNAYWERNVDNLEAGVIARTPSTANWRTANKISLDQYSCAIELATFENYAPIPSFTENENGLYNADMQFTSETYLTDTKLMLYRDMKNDTGDYFLSNYRNADLGAFSYRIYAVALFYADDWETLASICGIGASSIDNLLTYSNEILSNLEAVNFMLSQCTGDFMARAILSDTFLEALDESIYKTTICGNGHWNKFLTMVT